MRAYLREHLESLYRVIEAADGEEGLAKAREAEPDLIISDVMMPCLDGVGLVRALKQEEALRTIPVILLTARAAEADRLEGLEAKADDYIAKPFSAEELKVRIRNLIAARQAMRERYRREVVAVHPDDLDLDSAEAAFLNQARQEVEARLAEQAFNAQALAEAVYMSRSKLSRKLKDLTGLTPAAFIRHLRLARARQLLEQRAFETVAEVAHAVGFQNVVYFSRLYRKAFDHLPSEHAEAAPGPEPPRS